MSRIGWPLLLLGVLALAGALAWLFADAPPAEAGAARPPYVLPVTLAPVQRGDLAPRVQLTGSVRAARRAELAFERGGVLAELHVEEADALVADALVARLTDVDQRLALERARADQEVAARRTALLEAGARDEVLRRLRAEFEATEADERLAVLEEQRVSKLLKTNDVSQALMDRASADLAAASARREAAAQRLAEAEAGARLEDLAIARAQEAVAAQAVAAAERELAKTRLLAPWPGVVVRRDVSTGDHLAAGEPVVELVDLDALEILVEVPARHAVRLGDQPRVDLRIDEFPDFVHETVVDATVPAAAWASRNFTGLVRLSASDLDGVLLRPGMFVRLELHVEPLRDALLVPADAVRITPDGDLLAVADPAPDDVRDATGAEHVARLLPVRLLGNAEGRVAVEPLGGALSAGMQVVVTGVDLAFPDVPLLVRDDAGAASDRP